MSCAVITGSKGIALEVGKRLIGDGTVSQVIFLSRDAVKGAKAVESLPCSQALHLPFDLSIPSSPEFIDTCKQLEEWPQPISTLINCAGTVGSERLLVSTSQASIDQVFAVNLLGPIQLSKHVVKHMLRHPETANKSVVFVGSVVAPFGSVGQTVYGASKAGLVGLTKSLSKELGSRRIRVNCVEPGFTKTDMTKHLDESESLRKLGGSCLNRFGTAEEVANVISFLSSERASFVTGQVWRVDGGK